MSEPNETPVSLTLHGDDELMWVVGGHPVAWATRAEVLEALGVETEQHTEFTDEKGQRWQWATIPVEADDE